VEAALAHVRKSLGLRSAGVRHMNTGGLFRRWVADKGAEPPFWMLIGFGLGLAGSRITVHLILKYHLEKHLFALVAGSDPNPVHIHHFNYGLLIVGITGLVSLLPYGRRALRTLALLFGVGCALVFDEFALFWNLNPDYSQGLSLISAAIAAVVLIQLAYFRRFWTALFVRVAQWLGSE
jgi:lysyl-tRNA synthetase class 2